MLKIFKSVITANEDAGDLYERDSKHRFTMGFNEETQTINVKVEEVIAPNPDLSEDKPEGTDDIKRDVHTTSDYATVAERAFTSQDFPMRTDNCKWIVEYDSTTKTISDPLDVYQLATEYINGSDSHEKIYYNLNKYRYQSNPTKTPAFMVDSFFKELPGFTGSTLMFFVEDLQVDLLDTIIEDTTADVTTVTPTEYEFWCQYNVRTAVTFEVLDSEGKILSSAFQSVKPDAKSAGFIPLTQLKPPVLAGINPELNIQETVGISGNRFFVKLPSTDAYTIRVLFGNRIHNLIASRPGVTFDVACVNGISNKSRSIAKYDPANPNLYVEGFIAQHNHPEEKMTGVFAGADGLLVQTSGLVTGDFFKLKMNLGQFTSWAELWVEIA
jgi:hypothetical protein